MSLLESFEVDGYRLRCRIRWVSGSLRLDIDAQPGLILFEKGFFDDRPKYHRAIARVRSWVGEALFKLEECKEITAGVGYIVVSFYKEKYTHQEFSRLVERILIGRSLS